MVGALKCYVPYCGHNKRSAKCTFFRFPLNPSRCKEWVRKIGEEDFAYQLIEKLHQLRFVCSCHFRDNDFCSQLRKRLKDMAVPSILDTRIKDLPDEILNNFPPTKTSVMPVISFPIKMPSEDLQCMKLQKMVQNKRKQKDISHHLPMKLIDEDELKLQLPPSKRYRLSDLSKDSTGKPLTGCILRLDKKEFKTSSNTSNLRDHIICAHKKEYRPNPVVMQADIDNLQSHGVSQLKQCKLSSYVLGSEFYAPNYKRKQKIDEALTAFIAGDLRSFKTMDSRLFKNLIEVLDPTYEVPDHKQISGVLMPCLYEKVKQRLKGLIDVADFISLTTDIWTSIANQTFISLTCHFTRDDKFSSFILEVKQLETDGNTAQELASTVEIMLKDWNIPKEKIAYVVTDNAKNEENACAILKLKHFNCFAHTLNLVLEDTLSLELLKPLVEKCKNIVAYFKSSPKATCVLVKEQQKEGENKEPLKLKQEDPTRNSWNSLYFMIERIITLSDSLQKAVIKLKRLDLYFSQNELKVLRELKRILKMFNEVTEFTSGDGYIMVSSVIPIIYSLKDELNVLKEEVNTEEGKQILINLEESMETRLDVYESRTCTMMATLLDHRWKASFFQFDCNMQKAKNCLQNAVSHIVEYEKSSASTNEASDDAMTNLTPCSTGRHLMDGLEKKKKEMHANRTPTVDASHLVREYMKINPVANTEENNPVRYWAQESTIKQFHPMETLAKKFLCVPATSIPSERVFSTTGFSISKSRNRLSVKKANMQVFLQGNYDLLMEVLNET